MIMRNFLLILFAAILFFNLSSCASNSVGPSTSFEKNSKPSFYKNIVVVEANPEKGFSFPYLLKTSNQTANAKYLIVESNNTGSASSMQDMTSNAKKSLNYVFGSELAEKLNYPLLMPVFPYGGASPYSYGHYFPQLDSDVLKIDNNTTIRYDAVAADATIDHKRIDLQLIAMMDDARERLFKKNKQNIKSKAILVGFSSSSQFAARFTLLHPERVLLTVGGGIGGLLPTPSSEVNKIKVMYPIGIYDFKTITGKDFDLDEYQATPQFYWQGDKDQSNPFRQGAEDLSYAEFIVVKKLFTDELSFSTMPVSLKLNTVMWANSQKYINQITSNVKFESPKGEGHEITKKMIQKSIKFIKENLIH